MKRLGAIDVKSISDAYRKGYQEGAAAVLAQLSREGRLLPSDDEAAFQERAARIVAKADEVLKRRAG